MRDDDFDSREEAFENLYAHDEELHFKAVARRTKLLAAWAAGLMHKTGPDAEAYVKTIVGLTIADSRDEALIDRLRHDLDAARVALSDLQIRAEMDRFLTESLAYVRQS